jgi:hypothetical protein
MIFWAITERVRSKKAALNEVSCFFHFKGHFRGQKISGLRISNCPSEQFPLKIPVLLKIRLQKVEEGEIRGELIYYRCLSEWRGL